MEREGHAVGKEVALEFLIVAIQGVEIVKPEQPFGVVCHDVGARLMDMGGIEGHFLIFLEEFENFLEGLEALGAAVEEMGECCLVEGGTCEFELEHVIRCYFAV